MEEEPKNMEKNSGEEKVSPTLEPVDGGVTKHDIDQSIEAEKMEISEIGMEGSESSTAKVDLLDNNGKTLQKDESNITKDGNKETDDTPTGVDNKKEESAQSSKDITSKASKSSTIDIGESEKKSVMVDDEKSVRGSEVENKELGEQRAEDMEDEIPREYKTRRSKRGSTDDTLTSRKRTGSSVSSDEAPKKKLGRSTPIPTKQAGGQVKPQPIIDESHDKYCWVCHKEGVYYHCKICPRSYHMKCLCLPESSTETTKIESKEAAPSNVCVCPECVMIMKAENVETRSFAMKMLSMEQLSSMLKHICGSLRRTNGADPFLNPVQSGEAEDYYDFIVYPMDIHTLENNIKQRQYGSTEAFLADAQWIVHNSIIFNSATSTYTNAAKRLLKLCKNELAEIEACPECYLNAHKRVDTWFVEACVRPHLLVWAKLKGFPFWPAKAMRIKDDQVDVRFFGQHDRAWVNVKDCYLYSLEMPFPPPSKKPVGLTKSMEEVNEHVENLKAKFGEVTFAPVKTKIAPKITEEEIRGFLPKYVPENVDNRNAPRCTLQGPKYPLRSSKVSGPSNDSKGDTKMKPTGGNAEELDKNELDESVGDSEDMEHDSRVPNGEILANALGLRRIKRGSDPDQKKHTPENVEQKSLPLRKSTRLSESTTPVKQESTDIPESELTDESKRGAKTKNLMEQISNQTQTKPGYRFNISKDISISAIDDDNEEGNDGGEVSNTNRVGNSGMDGRNVNQRVNRPGGNQRLIIRKDGQSRPVANLPAASTSAGVRPVNKPVSRHAMQGALLPSIRKSKDGSYQSIRGEGTSVQGGSTIQPSQGAVTLPGGTITVTPLKTSVGGGPSNMPVGPKGANGLQMASGNNNARLSKVLRGQVQIQQQSQRNLSTASGVSPSVGTHLQQCMKSIEETVKKTIENVVAENQVGKATPDSVSVLQQRIQRLQMELADARHNNEIAVKELRVNYENEKKRALAELRRQFENEKQRIMTELKKKQWCAYCGSEALFYCCWNTSYCGYQCQEKHWPAHMGTCNQGGQGQGNRGMINNQPPLQNGAR